MRYKRGLGFYACGIQIECIECIECIERHTFQLAKSPRAFPIWELDTLDTHISMQLCVSHSPVILTATLLLTELSLITPLLCICFWLLYTNFSGSLRSAFVGLSCRSLVPFKWVQVLGLWVVMKGGAWGLYVHHDVVSHFENDFSKSPANSIY